MFSHCVMEVEEAEKKTLQADSNLDQITQQVQNLFKFRKFYNEMDCIANECMAITKVINSSSTHQEALIFVQR